MTLIPESRIVMALKEIVVDGSFLPTPRQVTDRRRGGAWEVTVRNNRYFVAPETLPVIADAFALRLKAKDDVKEKAMRYDEIVDTVVSRLGSKAIMALFLNEAAVIPFGEKTDDLLFNILEKHGAAHALSYFISDNRLDTIDGN